MDSSIDEKDFSRIKIEWFESNIYYCEGFWWNSFPNKKIKRIQIIIRISFANK